MKLRIPPVETGKLLLGTLSDRIHRLKIVLIVIIVFIVFSIIMIRKIYKIETKLLNAFDFEDNPDEGLSDAEKEAYHKSKK